MANPGALELVRSETNSRQRSAWEEFQHNDRMRRLHSISNDEMDVLSRVAALGEISSARDFLYILNTVRHALGR